jgi:phage-related protein
MAEFTHMPRYDVQISYAGDNVLISESEYGYEQRRKKHSFDRRLFAFTFSVRKTVEMNQIETFYKARNGAEEAFTWTDPVSSEEITMRIVPNSYKKNPMTKGASPIWSISFQTVEVRV